MQSGSKDEAECLKDPDSGVRGMAQWALTQIGKDGQ